MSLSSLFITGTDTDIGKTVLTATLLCALRGRGTNAICMKPFQTGATRTGEQWAAPDVELPLRWSQLCRDDLPHDLIAPYCFEPPCSPHLAAQQANLEPTLHHVTTCYTALASQYDTVLCEGAGGILVPINEQESMIDLADSLQLPVIVVARPNLGTLNHTLLTLSALRQRNLTVAGLVLVDRTGTPWGDIEKDNVATLERRGHTKILGVLPYVSNPADQAVIPNALLQEGQQILDRLLASNRQPLHPTL